MSNYHVFTSNKETHACSAAMYLICGVDTESQAVSKLYEFVQNGLQPMKYLKKYSIPDYTCGVSID